MSHSYGSSNPPDDSTTRTPGSTQPDRPTVTRHDDTSHTPATEPVDGGAVHTRPDRKTVISRERDEHGGVKIGSAFFGWLTATGMTVLLTALAVAAGTAIAVANNTTLDEATDEATSSSADTIGIAGAIILLVILLVAYFCGGYVAGRMARFDGAKQGVAVWLWAVVIAIAIAVLGVVAGAEYNVLNQLDAFPRIPVDEGDVTTAGVIALIAAVVIALVGAVLGGLAGMRFHRSVDKTGLGR